MDAEKLLWEQSGKEIKEILDLSILLPILPNEIFGIKYSLTEEKETFEYVNGHGNETGEFGTRMVPKVICDNKIFTYSEFNDLLKVKGVRV